MVLGIVVDDKGAYAGDNLVGTVWVAIPYSNGIGRLGTAFLVTSCRTSVQARGEIDGKAGSKPDVDELNDDGHGSQQRI